jgi:diaminopimelate decarboxylase
MNSAPSVYEPPRIEPLAAGHMNSKAFGSKTAFCSAIDGVPVEELLATHGSPLFVFSERTLRQTFRSAHSAFASRYRDVQFAWSYKTNYLKAICAVFHREGALAEVVSDFEYEKARALGIPGERIIFNGPHKPREILRRALRDGARIQVDNLDELMTIEEIVGEDNIPAPKVSLRVYLDAGIRPIWSKFGFNLEDEEAWRAARRLRHSGLVSLTGLHTHLGTFILDPNAYRVAAGKLVRFARRLRDELGFDISTLNLGGGFASRNRLHGQIRPAEEVVPSFDEYAEAISKGITESLQPGERPPRLLLETGRALVDESGYLITTVITNKRNRRFVDFSHGAANAKAPVHAVASAPGGPAVMVDTGVHHLYTANWYRQKIRPARPLSGQPEPTTVYGCLCMNIDVLQEATLLPPLSVGDALVIHPVGAYNLTQSMQFITYRPRVVMIMENGSVEVIREREDLNYIESLERLPNQFRPKNQSAGRPLMLPQLGLADTHDAPVANIPGKKGSR